MRKNTIIHVIILLFLTMGCNLASVTGAETPVGAMPEFDPIVGATEASVPESEPNSVDPGIPIIVAGEVARADCALLDVVSLNAIAGEEFTFKTQDQLGSCYYQSANYMLTIGGGEVTDVVSAEDFFMSILGKTPGAEWKSYPEGFMLGTASATTAITAQGISTSGHTLVIMVVGHPDGPKDAIMELTVEAASQLNAQWAQ